MGISLLAGFAIFLLFKVGYFYTPLDWEKEEGGLKVSS